MPMKIAMIAPPWLPIPPSGYGGTEAVLQFLIPQLRRLGAHVTLFTVGSTQIDVDAKYWYYGDGQYPHIHKMLNESLPLPITHMLFALKHIRDGGFDLIHDHNGYAEAAILTHLDPAHFPPALQTIHGPFSTDEMVVNGMPDNRPLYEQINGYGEQLFFNGISFSQMSQAPPRLRSRITGVVHNPIEVAVYPFHAAKDDYYITLARFNRDKGQHTAAKLCAELGLNLRMAGTVNGIGTPGELMAELSNASSPASNNADMVYFRKSILPYLKPGQIDYMGNVGGEAKMRFISRAKALLFPIDWEEPFGMAVVEAMACGTPVVAYRRGSMPELIEHGVTGFLADNETQFKDYMLRVGEIDPAVCRRRMNEKFSAQSVARKYMDIYANILETKKPLAWANDFLVQREAA